MSGFYTSDTLIYDVNDDLVYDVNDTLIYYDLNNDHEDSDLSQSQGFVVAACARHLTIALMMMTKRFQS